MLRFIESIWWNFVPNSLYGIGEVNHTILFSKIYYMVGFSGTLSYAVFVYLCVCVFGYLYLRFWQMGISFWTSLNNPLFRNIPHGGFFWQFVICCICVFVCLCICVFVFLYLRFWHIGISFLTSLNNPLFKNIPHGGSFWHFVICCICVFVCLCICVFVFGLGRSLLDQFGQKNASPLSSTFWFERPKLRYVLKTVLHCKGRGQKKLIE